MIVEYFVDNAGGHRFRIKGNNGEVIATSEAYSRRGDAGRGLADLTRNFATDNVLVTTDAPAHVAGDVPDDPREIDDVTDEETL